MSPLIDPAALPAGTRIHAYEVLSLLGQGGMGAVYKVVRDGKAYALKLAVQLNSEVTAEQRAHADNRTRREVATLAAINHPNVVHIRAFDRWPDSEEGHLYLVTDLVEGDRLYTWQRKHQPSLRNLCGVFLHIADALHELHRHEVFHRDLKSENVLIRNDGEPILIDFGIARQRSASTLTSAGTIVGTSTHLSPDFCRYVTTLQGAKGERYTYHPTDDLHAVGYMLYELLTGKPPFELVDDNEWDLLLDIANKQPLSPRELNPEVPVALDDVVTRLLSKDSPQRFSDAKELAGALTAALENAGEDWGQPFLPPSPHQGPAFDAQGRSRSREHLSGDGLASLLFQEDSSGARHQRPPTPPTRPIASGAPPAGKSPAPAAPAVAPVAAPEFRAPSEEKPAFRPSAESQPQALPPPPEAATSIPTAIRAAGVQLAARERQPSRTALLAALGGAAAMGVVGLTLFSGKAHEAAQPRSLLASYEREKQQANSTPPPKPAPPSETTTPPPEQASVATSQPAAQAATPTSPPPTQPTKQPAPRSAARADRAPAAPHQPASPPRPPDVATAPSTNSASWLKTAQSIEQPKSAPASDAGKLGVPFGAHLRVRLRSALDSRAPNDALVEALLPRPFLQGGEALLAPRTMAYGSVQVSGGRFLIRFTRLRLPDNREVPFTGTALDLSDGKPGLAPTRRTSSTGASSDDVATAVLRTSANILLGKAGGDTGSQLASATGQTVLNHQDAAPSAGGDTALFLDAGADFDIVVKDSF